MTLVDTRPACYCRICGWSGSIIQGQTHCPDCGRHALVAVPSDVELFDVPEDEDTQ